MVSQRARDTSPFLAMDVLQRANEMDDIVHLEVGEPDFEPPDSVVEAAVDSVRSGDTNYTEAGGKPELRRAIADYYDRQYGVDVPPERIIVTPGSSPGLLLTCLALLDPGDEVLLTDPHYACYPNFIRQADATVRTVELDVSEGFAPNLTRFADALADRPEALLLNSPSNPTGAVLDGDTLRELVEMAGERDTTIISDEIYHGLDYDVEAHSVLEYTNDAFVADGFSKRFAMTGWRLGWVVVPPEYVEPATRLAQNLFICAPSFVQDAGIAALETTEQLDQIRDTFQRRRDFLVDAVDDWGLSLDYTPGGAYYLLIDVDDLPGDSLDIAEVLLEDAGVALTPGVDFGSTAEDYLRVSYANSEENLREASRRIEAFLETVDHPLGDR